MELSDRLNTIGITQYNMWENWGQVKEAEDPEEAGSRCCELIPHLETVLIAAVVTGGGC